MRSAILLGAFASFAVACRNPENDACLKALTVSSAEAAPFCAAYIKTKNTATTGLPAFAAACDNKPKKLSSACSCLQVPTTMATVSRTSKPHAAQTYAPYVPIKSAGHKVKTTPVVTTSVPAKTKATTSVPTSTKDTTSPAATYAPAAPAGCTAKSFSEIAGIVAKCTNIVLHNIAVPAKCVLDLTKLKDGSTVTFSGTTTFGTTPDKDFDPIIITGKGITITGAKGHVIEGNGAAYWDGLGSNGGRPKPNHFVVVKNVVNGIISNLNIKNWPVHCFYISGAQGLVVSGLNLDNTAGDAPNSLSGSKPAAHNSDGFDVSGSDKVTIKDCVVKNQDDCVAVTSGTNILVTKMTCSGGHGLSIGSIGGKKLNTVSDVTFSDSTISDSTNGCRIKSNSGTTGSISNIVYSNIKLSNIEDYGIVIQQDYLNGGPTGKPTNGVAIKNVTMKNITGNMKGSGSTSYYILCGSGSCSNFVLSGVSITGGSQTSSCNFPAGGCPK